MVNLRTYVQRNADSFFVERAGLSNWTSLNVSLGVGYEQDTATYTVVSTPDVSLPAKSAKMRFVADGAKIATLEVGELSGDTQDGSLIIECSAIDPESPLRQTKTREWPFQTIGGLTRAIAADAGLTPAVNAVVGGFLLVPRTQNGVSDLAFLQQVCSQNAGRVLVQEGRLIVTLVDQPFASLPTLTIDIIAEGAWVGWRRNWSRGVGQVVASYVEDDGVTVNLVTVGSGTPAKRLPEIYPSRAEAAAGANAHLVAGDVSRDFVEITTGFTPRAQVLQPLTIVNAGPTIPIGFPPLVVRSVQHTIGRAAAVSIITARPAASQSAQDRLQDLS